MLYTVWAGGTEVNDCYFDNIHEVSHNAKRTLLLTGLNPNESSYK